MNNETQESKAQLDVLIKDLEENFICLIRDRLGILIHSHQITNLYKILSNACQKFNLSPNDYLDLLSKCSEDSPLIDYLITGITIGETYFFRDKHQMQLLEEVLLPTLIAMKRQQKQLSLRIWSAGCATGEEIYTIAMMLAEMLPDYREWTIHLLGTDINTVALKSAIAGNYSEWAMRTISDYYKQKYFEKNNRKYILSPTIRNQVNFAYLNLNDNNYPSISSGTNAQDLILCRNVLIYFDIEHTANLMKKISSCISTGGFLMLGASDPIVVANTKLKVHHQPGLYFSRDELAPVKIDKPKPKPTPIPTKVSVSLPDKVNYSKKISLKPEIKVDLAHIETLLNEAKWQEILDFIGTYNENLTKTVSVLNAKAVALASLGNLEMALQACEASLAQDTTNKRTYFIYSLILSELNEINKAEELLRKALFLDHQFFEAHFRLGMLQLRNKKNKEGLKSLKNTLAIAETKNPTDTTSEFRGLDYGQIADILRHEIDLYNTSKDT